MNDCTHTPQGHVCPPTKKGALQFEALKAAKSGDVEKVKAFLEAGGDVNGGDLNGMTMLYAACDGGRKEVVTELLKRPDIHLNSRFSGATALAKAALLGHEECVKLLLGYTGKCDLNLRIRNNFANRAPLSVLSVSALNKHWIIFRILLKETDVISPEEFPEIISSAVAVDQWDAIQELLQKDIQYYGYEFTWFLKEAYTHQLCDTIQLVFQRALLHENYSVLVILREMFQRKDWNNLESLLKCVNQTLKVDIPLAEALRCKQHQEVEEMLREKNFDADTMSGNFLLACASGTSEDAAQALMSNVSKYSDETLKYALLLTSTFNRLELLTPLLVLDKFSYKNINCAYNRAVRYKCMDAQKLLKFSLSDKACGIFPKIKNCLKLDITDEDE